MHPPVQSFSITCTQLNNCLETPLLQNLDSGLWSLDWTMHWTVDSVCDDHDRSIGALGSTRYVIVQVYGGGEEGVDRVTSHPLH